MNRVLRKQKGYKMKIIVGFIIHSNIQPSFFSRLIYVTQLKVQHVRIFINDNIIHAPKHFFAVGQLPRNFTGAHSYHISSPKIRQKACCLVFTTLFLSVANPILYNIRASFPFLFGDLGKTQNCSGGIQVEKAEN